MGDSFYELGSPSLPLHNVQVDALFMDRYEVKKELWVAVHAWATGHGYSINTGSFVTNAHPVQNISWYDAVKWCNARSEKEGLIACYYTDTAHTNVYRTGASATVSNAMVKWNATGYRLPTEAEWEKAARGGTLGYRYPWGNNIDGSHANYATSGDPRDGQGVGTQPVGYYNGGQTPTGSDMANGYGLYDMAGNVGEWCWDWYDINYYSDPTANNNPQGPISGSNRICRGGSYASGSTLSDLRCANRGATFQGNSYTHVGFRCVRSFETPMNETVLCPRTPSSMKSARPATTSRKSRVTTSSGCSNMRASASAKLLPMD